MTVNVTLTFPETVLERIDNERGEIKRSTYVTKLLQQTYEAKLSEDNVVCGRQNENKDSLKKLSQTRRKVEHHEEPAIGDAKTTQRGF